MAAGGQQQGLQAYSGVQMGLVAGGAPLPSRDEFETITSMAAFVYRGALFTSRGIDSVEKAVTVMMLGRDLGISVMAACQKCYVIPVPGGGFKVDFETDVKLQVVQARVPDFEYEVLEQTAEACEVKGGIKGRQQVTVRLTLEDAKRRKWALDKHGNMKDSYANNSEDMLFWRVMTRVLKKTSAGALYGAAMPLGLFETDEDLDERVPIEGRATVVDDGSGSPRPQEAARIAKDAQAPPVDLREMTLERIWKMNGSKSGEKALRSINALLAERQMKPVKRDVEIVPSDWKWMFERLDASYDEQGKPRPDRPGPTKPAATPVPPVEVAGPQASEAPAEEAPPADDEEEADPTRPDADLVARAVQGDAAALLDLGMWHDNTFLSSGATKVGAISEYPAGSGLYFFKHGEVLRAVGGECVAMKNGKQTAVSKLIGFPIERSDLQLPPPDVLQAIGYRLAEHLVKLHEAARSTGLTAKGAEAHREASA